MAAVFPVSNYETIPFVLSDGAEHVVATCPKNMWWEVTHIMVTAGTGTAGSNAVIKWFQNSSNATYVLNDGAPVAAGVPAEWEGMPLHMEVSDTIKVTGAANYHVFVTVIKGSRQPDAARSRG